MSVTAEHKQYKEFKEKRQRCRDAISGKDAIVKRGAIYLPRLSGMDEDEYAAYQNRALYFGASKRTVQGLLGAVYRKDPVFNYPDEKHIDSITISGESAWSFGQRCIKELISIGRIGLLVDVYNNSDRAFVSLYIYENIINWETDIVNGEKRLTKVVLREVYTVSGDDEFEKEEKTQYRVLDLFNNTYRQRLFRKADSATDYVSVSKDEKGNNYPIFPKKNGKFLDFIPFQFINPSSLTTDIEDSPIQELVDTNLSHYRTSADLEHGAHFTALPTPWVAGFPLNTVLKIGSGVAWVSDKPDANAGMLEYTGQGLRALVDLMESKEKKMAVLGARMLEEQKPSVEAYDTQKMRLSGESGALVSITRMASEGFTKVMEWVAWWSNIKEGDIEISFNTDFFDSSLSPQMLIAMMQAYQTQNISFETWIYNLNKSEMLPPDTTAEIEYERIANNNGRLLNLDLTKTFPQKTVDKNTSDLIDNNDT